MKMRCAFSELFNHPDSAGRGPGEFAAEFAIVVAAKYGDL
jgi:hypothetical protein